MTIFQKNINAFSKVEPGLAKKIADIETNVIYEVFADQDPSNTNFVDNRTMTPVYSTNASDEIVRQFQHYGQFSCYPFLFFFGLGNGILYKVLLDNKRLQKLVIFEPELEMIYIVFNLVDFSQELMDGRLLIFPTADVTLDNMTRLMEEAKIFIKTYDLHQPLSYYDYAHEEMVRVNKIALRAMHYILYALGNDPKDAVEGVENFIANLPDMIQSPKLTEALKAIKNTKTAIIVSTGPSLSKQLPLLKKIAPYVTIICIDASFPILYRHEIKPDIVVSLERVIATSAFYKSVPDDFQKDVIFFISALAHKGLLHSLEKGVVQLSMRDFGYMSYFGLDEWGYIGIGASAANMAFEIAYHAKFDNVVFIGQDLSFAQDGRSHSANHIFGENEIHNVTEYLQVEGYGGGHTVATTATWKSFLDFFERNIPLVNTQINVINATEGGARIHGTVEKSFSQVAQEVLSSAQKKKTIILATPKEKEIKQNLKKIDEKIAGFLTYGQKVQKEIETVFLNIATYLEAYENLSMQEHIAKADLTTLQILVNMIDSIKQYLNDQHFTRLFHESYKSVTIQQEIENGPIRVMSEESDEQKKEKYLLWIKAHKQWLFFLAGAVHATCESIEKGKAVWNTEAYFNSKVFWKANYLSGYIYDIYQPSLDKTVCLYIDDQPAVSTIANLPQPDLKVLDAENRHHRFILELPEMLFDDAEHTIVLREVESKMAVGGSYVKTRFTSSNKIRCGVKKINAITYKGWCKKVGSTEAQSMDIYMDEKLIMSLKCDRYLGTIDELEISGRFGFHYIVPERYFDAQKHTLQFKPAGSTVILPENTFGFELDKSDAGKYKEEIFAERLGNLDLNQSQDLFSKNGVGFLGVTQNLGNPVFMNYVKELKISVPEMILKAICFTEAEKEAVERAFEKDEIDIVSPSSMAELASEIEVYLFTNANELETTISQAIRLSCTKIAAIYIHAPAVDMRICDLDRANRTDKNPILENPSYFGFATEQMEKAKGNTIRLVYGNYFPHLADDDNLAEFLYHKALVGMLRDEGMKEHVIRHLEKETRFSREFYNG